VNALTTIAYVLKKNVDSPQLAGVLPLLGGRDFSADQLDTLLGVAFSLANAGTSIPSTNYVSGLLVRFPSPCTGRQTYEHAEGVHTQEGEEGRDMQAHVTLRGNAQEAHEGASACSEFARESLLNYECRISDVQCLNLNDFAPRIFHGTSGPFLSILLDC